MDPQRWKEIDRVLAAALECAPAERSAFLDEACKTDEELRKEVESLLAHHVQESMFGAHAVNEATRLLELKAGQLTSDRIGHYRIIRSLGVGGMGRVYLGLDEKLNRPVAIKLLSNYNASEKERTRRFVLEAQAAAALNHPNIAHIYEIGEDQSTHFIAMEFVDGDTLGKKFREGSELKVLLKYLLQVAQGLAKAHASGIVHRDLKPENVMITRDGHAKILDFGLAKLLDTTRQKSGAEEPAASGMATVLMPLELSSPGVAMGTVGYMSPEQAQAKSVDQRSDIFSFGCILYEVATGRKPFTGESARDILHKIIYEPAPSIIDLNPAASPELQRVIRKCLAKEPEKRYQTIVDTANDLEELIQAMQGPSDIDRSVAPSTSATSGSTNSTDENVPAESTVPVGRKVPNAEYITSGIKQHKYVAVVLLMFIAAAAVFAYRYLLSTRSQPIESIAVMPFTNESGNGDVEYLSDGMTDSLINSLSQLPHLAVKARSSIFRYKGKEAEPQRIASELSVQAILNGRVVQRGNDLTLYLSLVDARTGNQVWGEEYNRKLADIVALQKEIALDVSNKLRVKLSGADEQKVAKNYPANPEAYQLYLKGRFNILKLTPPEIEKGVSYFQQAIQIDPNYALAYAGLGDGYRSLVLSAEMAPNDFLPKAKLAAQKAIELDETLPEAHAALGIALFWYDWNWNEAENQYKRALELNPNSADTHLFYGHLCSNTGRATEALAEIKRGRELDPFSPFLSTLEGQFLNYAGKPDEALARLRDTFELAPDFWFPHAFAASAYINKGMFAEAITEARRARELGSEQTISVAFEGYALAKSDKRDEAQAVLDALLKRSKEHFVPPYHIAMVYNGLGDRDQALAWLEHGLEQRDPKMTFLKVEPNWNNLRNDPRFQDLMRRVGFSQ